MSTMEIPEIMADFKLAKKEFRRDYSASMKYRIEGLFDSLVDNLHIQLAKNPSSVLVPKGSIQAEQPEDDSPDNEQAFTERELFDDGDAIGAYGLDASFDWNYSMYANKRQKTDRKSNALPDGTFDNAIEVSEDDDEDEIGINFVPTSRQYTFRCDYTGCGAAFQSRSELFEHTKGYHIKSRLEKQMSIEPRIAANGGRKERKVTNFVCPHEGCGKLFRSAQEQMNHYRVHSGVKPYACIWPNCNYHSRQLGHITTHVRIVHFGLPKYQREQQEKGIVDERNPRDYIQYRNSDFGGVE